MHFPCLDGTFGSIHTLVVGFNQLQFTIFFGKEFFNILCGLVVHYVHFDFEAFLLEHIEIFLIGVGDDLVGHAVDGSGEDAVGLVVVHDEVTDTPIDRNEREVAGHVVVDNTCMLVCKCTETKYVCNRCIAIIRDDVSTLVLRQ